MDFSQKYQCTFQPDEEYQRYLDMWLEYYSITYHMPENMCRESWQEYIRIFGTNRSWIDKTKSCAAKYEVLRKYEKKYGGNR